MSRGIGLGSVVCVCLASTVACAQDPKTPPKPRFDSVERVVYPDAPARVVLKVWFSTGEISLDVFGLSPDGEETDSQTDSTDHGDGRSTLHFKGFRQRGKLTAAEREELEAALQNADLATVRLPVKRIPAKAVKRRTKTGSRTWTTAAKDARDFTLTFRATPDVSAEVELKGLRGFYGKARARMSSVMDVLDRLQGRLAGPKLQARLKTSADLYHEEIAKLSGRAAEWAAKGLSVRERARKAVELRHRAEARLSEKLGAPPPKQKSFEELVKKYQTGKGLKGDAAYRAILSSAIGDRSAENDLEKNPKSPAEPRPRFCDQCGNKLGPESKFCSGCGRRL